MNPNYALLVLKEQKQNLINTNLHKYEEKHGEESVNKVRTIIKHQIKSLDSAIEILETYKQK
jgi:hypothetical protein